MQRRRSSLYRRKYCAARTFRAVSSIVTSAKRRWAFGISDSTGALIDLPIGVLNTRMGAPERVRRSFWDGARRLLPLWQSA